MNDLIDKLPALKEAYPFKSHFCDLSYGNGQSAKLHYLDEGTGPVILCFMEIQLGPSTLEIASIILKLEGLGVLFRTIWAVVCLISLKIIHTL